MHEDLQELFDYCGIPMTGQEIIANDFDLKNKAIKEFSNNKDVFKYLNPISLSCRFFFNTEDVTCLYHFLPITDAVNIIKSKTFYIGNQNDMNDPLEKNYVWYKCREYLEKVYNSKRVLKEFDNFKDYALKNMFDTYVWSFTVGRNTHLLNNYGQCALKLNSKITYRQLKSSNCNFSSTVVLNAILIPGVYPIKVCYDESIQNDCISHLADYFYELISQDDLDSCKYLIQVLTFYMLVFKGESWSKENEYRLLISRPVNKKQKSYDCLFHNKPKVKGNIVPNNLLSILITKENMNLVDSFRQLLIENSFENTTIKLV